MVVSEAAAAGHAYDGYGLEPAWSTEQVPGQPKLHRETLSQKETKTKTKHKAKQNKTLKTYLYSDLSYHVPYHTEAAPLIDILVL